MKTLAPIAVSATSFCKSDLLKTLATDQLAPRQVRFGGGGLSISQQDLIKLLQGCVGAIVGREPINDAVLEQLPELKAIAKYGVGTDNIDFAACARRGVEVLVSRGANAPAVAEHTVGLMLAVLRNIASAFFRLRNAEWHKDGGVQLTGKCVAIIGVGAIGSRVARLLTAFGCKLLLVDIEDKASLAKELGAIQVSFEEAIRTADVVSFHVPLTTATERMLGIKNLSSLKANAIVVNTSRGEVIDQKALLKALKDRTIAGAALDVFESEPILDKAFWNVPGLVGTPHIAGNSVEAVWAMGTAAVTLLKDRLSLMTQR